MKKILNLKGAQQLSKNEQQSITGGLPDVCGSGFTQIVVPLSEASCAPNGGIWKYGRCFYCF